MNSRTQKAVLLALSISSACPAGESPGSLDVIGVSVTPHVQSKALQYSRPADFSLGARVEMFLRNASDKPLTLDENFPATFRGRTAAELLEGGEWAWFDTPSAWPGQTLKLPPGALTVWSFNSRRSSWGTGTSMSLSTGPGAGPQQDFQIELADPKVWLSAVTFLGPSNSVAPDSMIFHVANESDEPLRIVSCRLWLPVSNDSWRALVPGEPITTMECFPASRTIPARDRGGAIVRTGRLPLSYAAVEVRLEDPRAGVKTVWAHLRVKRECFDISGGWVASGLGGSNTLHCEPYLKTLRRAHINTGHIAAVPGYTDQDGPGGLYSRYPLKYFNELRPTAKFETEAMLPRIHAVEFLGEPQYGGGKPVAPMEVWQKLASYQSSKLATTLTHSEERIWRYYAGLSDYPHYDAYRVTAPSPDAWSKYNRWGGKSIRWGSPLETIGDMSRSLRELNRPKPVAYWSQGPGSGWDVYGGRQRTSPTPDELYAQAYHALATRITSLYWFNPSLKAIVKFPDLIEPMTRVGREIRMLEEYYLEGDASGYVRSLREGKPDWDLYVVSSPRGAVLFALDLAYEADSEERVFRFGEARPAKFEFRLPAYCKKVADVFRVDADGVTKTPYTMLDGVIRIEDRVSREAIYVAALDASESKRIEARRQALIAEEASVNFDPARNPSDLQVLQKLAAGSRKRD